MGRPRLSVVCVSHHPGHQVAAALAPLRELAGEIIVAADARAPPVDLGHYARVADRSTGSRWIISSIGSAGSWRNAGASGSCAWTATRSSQALVDALPELLADEGVLGYWLFGDRDSWLAGLPCWPDYDNRLVRAGAAARHPGVMHAPITPWGRRGTSRRRSIPHVADRLARRLGGLRPAPRAVPTGS